MEPFDLARGGQGGGCATFTLPPSFTALTGHFSQACTVVGWLPTRYMSGPVARQRDEEGSAAPEIGHQLTVASGPYFAR